MKIGVNPKINFQYPFETQGLLTDNYPVQFKRLPTSVQRNIAEYLETLYGGYYPDLLNLYKRVMALAVEAKIGLIKSKRALLNKEKVAFVQQLVELLNIPIYITDSTTGYNYLILDNELYQSFYNELFNSELIITALNLFEVTEEQILKLEKESVSKMWAKYLDDRLV